MQRGHQVSVCCSDYLDLKRRVDVKTWDRGVSEPILWDGIQVVYAKSFHLGFGGFGAIVSFALWPYLNREAKKYDVIHIHGAWNALHVMAGIAAKLNGIPYVIQLHNTFPIRSHRIMLKKVFHQLIRTPLLNGAAAIMSFTSDEQEDYLRLRAHDRNKTYIVPSIVPKVELPERGLFRRKWNISKEDCLILFLGRLHEVKGIEHLILSLQHVRQNAAILVLVGPDAGHQTSLEETVQSLRLGERVLFTGPIYGDEKYSAYNDADIFVLPSKFEQLPVSALEAALCEVPLILSNRCGMTKMITEAEAGIVVPYGSPQDLSDAIEALCINPDRRRRMGQNAKTMVESYCNPGNVIDALEAVYKKSLSQEI